MRLWDALGFFRIAQTAAKKVYILRVGRKTSLPTSRVNATADSFLIESDFSANQTIGNHSTSVIDVVEFSVELQRLDHRFVGNLGFY